MSVRYSVPTLAGTKCEYKSETHKCEMYARYAVTSIHNEAHNIDPIGVCGQHMPTAVRDIWRVDHAAAIIQEIPGMWHDKRHDIIRK